MKLLLGLPIFFLFSTGCMQEILCREYPKISRAEELVNDTLVKSAKTISKKYNLYASGTGAGMPGGNIKSLMLSFDKRGILTKEELRKILIHSTQDFLPQINAKQEMIPFLNNRPFQVENIKITIFLSDLTGSDLYDPFIAIAGITNGILSYETIDPEDTFKIKNRYEEAYEEARKIVSTSKKSKQ